MLTLVREKSIFLIVYVMLQGDTEDVKIWLTDCLLTGASCEYSYIGISFGNTYLYLLQRKGLEAPACLDTFLSLFCSRRHLITIKLIGE